MHSWWAMGFARLGAHTTSGLLSMTTPLPVGGRWRLQPYVKVADQPWVSGMEYWRFLAVMPATGVFATALACASSGLFSTLSIDGFCCGIARPKILLMAPKIPDCELIVKPASIPVRNGLNTAVSLRMSP
ncbi:MAG TPA: hypothetical protein VK481_01830 [Gemmatimonadaceae bacterium]|nr:hypothetical protein [Gemmatimonadaceae bacterium]